MLALKSFSCHDGCNGNSVERHGEFVTERYHWPPRQWYLGKTSELDAGRTRAQGGPMGYLPLAMGHESGVVSRSAAPDSC